MINSVRNTVLSVLNKNNYGYISPSDFNLFAKQAQLEIFEDYFSRYNDIINKENARVSGTDYGDDRKAVEEAMETFITTDLLHPVVYPGSNQGRVGRFYLPNIINNGNDYFMINNIETNCETVLNSSNTALDAQFPNTLIDTTQNFYAVNDPLIECIVINISSNDWAYITSVQSPIRLELSKNLLSNIGDAYTIKNIRKYNIAEKLTPQKWNMMRQQVFVGPNCKYPVYTQNDNNIDVYPYITNISEFILGDVKCNYFRYPLDPKWTYAQVLTNGEPIFNPSAVDYQDFELPIEDEPRLVVKILQYCGISIREAEVYQAAKAQELQDKKIS